MLGRKERAADTRDVGLEGFEARHAEVRGFGARGNMRYL